jgi:hypothetical protein
MYYFVCRLPTFPSPWGKSQNRCGSVLEEEKENWQQMQLIERETAADAFREVDLLLDKTFLSSVAYLLFFFVAYTEVGSTSRKKNGRRKIKRRNKS